MIRPNSCSRNVCYMLYYIGYIIEYTTKIKYLDSSHSLYELCSRAQLLLEWIVGERSEVWFNHVDFHINIYEILMRSNELPHNLMTNHNGIWETLINWHLFMISPGLQWKHALSISKQMYNWISLQIGVQHNSEISHYAENRQITIKNCPWIHDEIPCDATNNICL